MYSATISHEVTGKRIVSLVESSEQKMKTEAVSYESQNVSVAKILAEIDLRLTS